MMKINTSRPYVFQKTTASIWTDPYIQQRMLEEHLNLESDGASRNKNSIHKIIGFIVDNIPRESKLLDLGCGPGLYAEILEDKGFKVTGIDFNKSAIEYASAHNKNVTYVEGDYINDFPYGEYDAIILIYCDFGTFSDRERESLLENCYRSLRPGGKLIFDVFNEQLINDKKEGKDWEYNREGGFWSDKEYLLISETFHYPDNKAFGYQYNLISEEGNKHFIVWDRYYSKNEIIGLLGSKGYKNIVINESLLSSNNFTSNNQMFVVGEK